MDESSGQTVRQEKLIGEEVLPHHTGSKQQAVFHSDYLALMAEFIIAAQQFEFKFLKIG